ncbi:MAG TPA: class I SAM-dependent methyltransferase, partial [Ferruginibacter sp.]|nr:class I SAM-dependent methyltransferase [Ferruginibacter sp.]
MIQQLNCPVCLSANLQQCLTAKDYTATGEVFPIIHCHDCTVRFTGVIPEPDQMGRYYHADAYISHTDTRKGLVHQLYHLVRTVTLKSKRKLVNQLAGTRRGTLLDVGCGTGAFAGSMQASGWKVVALEPEAQARAVALELHGIEALPAEVLSTLHLSADAITLWHVLEHVHDVHEYMNHLHRLLSNNGVLLIAVPNYTSL